MEFIDENNMDQKPKRESAINKGCKAGIFRLTKFRIQSKGILSSNFCPVGMIYQIKKIKRIYNLL